MRYCNQGLEADLKEYRQRHVERRQFAYVEGQELSSRKDSMSRVLQTSGVRRHESNTCTDQSMFQNQTDSVKALRDCTPKHHVPARDNLSNQTR